MTRWYGLIAEIEDLQPRLRYTQRCYQRAIQLSAIDRPNGALDANAGYDSVGLQPIALRDREKFAARKHPLNSGERSQTDYCIGIERAQEGNSTRYIPRNDLVGGYWNAIAGRQHGATYENQCNSHCVTLLTCWYISSAALTTFEFAS